MSHWPFRWKPFAGRRRRGLQPRSVLGGVCRRRCCRSSSCYWRATFWPPWLSTDWRKNTWPSPPWPCKGGVWARWWPSVGAMGPRWRYAIWPRSLPVVLSGRGSLRWPPTDDPSNGGGRWRRDQQVPALFTRHNFGISADETFSTI